MYFGVYTHEYVTNVFVCVLLHVYNNCVFVSVCIGVCACAYVCVCVCLSLRYI